MDIITTNNSEKREPNIRIHEKYIIGAKLILRPKIRETEKNCAITESISTTIKITIFLLKILRMFFSPQFLCKGLTSHILLN